MHGCELQLAIEIRPLLLIMRSSTLHNLYRSIQVWNKGKTIWLGFSEKKHSMYYCKPIFLKILAVITRFDIDPIRALEFTFNICMNGKANI